MTDEELRALPDVLPEHASKYLGGRPSPQYIRIWCKEHRCPFGDAIQEKSRANITINPELLIKYKHGEIPLGLPQKLMCMFQNLFGKGVDGL